MLAAALGFLTGLQRQPAYWLVNVPFMLYIAAHLLHRQPNSTGSKHDDSLVNIALSFIAVGIVVLFWFSIGALIHRALT